MSEFDPRNTPKPHEQPLTIQDGQGFLLGDLAIVSYALMGDLFFDNDRKLRPYLVITATTATSLIQPRNIHKGLLPPKPPSEDIRTTELRISKSDERKITYVGFDFSLELVRWGPEAGEFVLSSANPCKPEEVPAEVDFKEYLRNVRMAQATTQNNLPGS